MRRYSITRRLVTTILIVEFVLAALATTVELAYLRGQHLKTFDIMLRGRADSLFGAVQDLEDQPNSVYLDTSVLDLPERDVYEVREESGSLIGRSSNWGGLKTIPATTTSPFLPARVNDRDYRALVLHLVRNIDPNAEGPGSQHRIAIYYAAPMHPVWHVLKDEAKLLVLGNSMLLLLTGIAVALLLRREMAPLRALAGEASAISAQSWKFEAPEQAYAAKELYPLATALNLALKRLEQSFRQQQVFVSDAAHELKTAVTIVKSSLQLLTYKERSPTEYREGLELCLLDCGRLEELVGKMLALASVEQAVTDTHRYSEAENGVEYDLGDCAMFAIDQVSPLALLRQVEVKLAIPSPVDSVLPRMECLTLLSNLLVNAIQHSRAGSTVEVVVRPNGFMVQDHGEGISSDALPFVFDRFFREDRSRARNTGGTGLGLAICKAIVDAHSGSITIQSEPGQGTLVTVKLPLPRRAASSGVSEGSFLQPVASSRND